MEISTWEISDFDSAVEKQINNTIYIYTTMWPCTSGLECRGARAALSIARSSSARSCCTTGRSTGTSGGTCCRCWWRGSTCTE